MFIFAVFSLYCLYKFFFLSFLLLAALAAAVAPINFLANPSILVEVFVPSGLSIPIYFLISAVSAVILYFGADAIARVCSSTDFSKYSGACFDNLLDLLPLITYLLPKPVL